MPTKAKMIQQYFDTYENYKKQYGERIILLWQCGGFYEVYGLKCIKTGVLDPNIEKYGKITDYAVKDKQVKTGNGKIPLKFNKNYTVVMAGSPISGSIEGKIKKLNENGYIVALWKQDEKIKDIREEYAVFSPGTNFICDDNISNNIMCVYLQCMKKTLLSKNPRISCGLSIIDVITGKTIYYEYHTEYFNESINYDEIERFYSIYNPSEIIIIHNFEDEKNLKNMITYSSIKCDVKHSINTNDSLHSFYNEVKNCNKQKYQIEIFEKFYNIIDSDFFYANFAPYEYATSSFCFLLNFVYKHQKNLVKNIKIPIFDNNKYTLRLENHSLKQLNIIKDNNNQTKLASVLSFLNNCKTTMGKRLFNYNLLHPTSHEEKLQLEYDTIEHVLNNRNYIEGDNLSLFKNICDIEKFYRKIILNVVTPSDIYTFYSSLNYIKKIYKSIKHDTTMISYLCNHIQVEELNICEYITKLENEINNKLFIDTISSINTRSIDENIFKYGIYEEVDEAIAEFEKSKIKIDAIQKWFNSILSKFEKKNKNGVKLTIKETTYPYLETTNRRCKGIQSEFKHNRKVKIQYKYMNTELSFQLDLSNIKYEKSTKNNCKIVSPFLDKLYEKIFKGNEEIKKCVKSCFKLYTENLLNFSQQIETLSNFIKYTDVLFTKANLSVKYNYCKPEIIKHEKSFFKAEKLRHVLIEHIQQNEIYVPNDIQLGINEDGMLLYGTNAVGKSSLIKSIGITIIMAQAGMYVPCNTFNYNPYKSLYTRILGNDDIFKGLSSFAVEMSELKSILKADENSLILGDELCRGTEFNSAIRIFIAGLVSLNKTRCSHIFATHFHEITKMKEIYSLSTLVMKHMSVEYDGNTLVYNRILKDGPGNNNYGLVVCKSLGLPEEFINYAYSLDLNFKIYEENVMKNKIAKKYNSQFVKKKLCELCGINNSEDVHHMIPQNRANSDKIINAQNLVFNKNHKANLMNICKSCHEKETKSNRELIRKKTTNGYKVISCV
jgi:DNA mismatch repair protein MutS